MSAARSDPEAYLRDLFRVLAPQGRCLELYWAQTRARLDFKQLAAEIGPLAVPPPFPSAATTEKQATPGWPDRLLSAGHTREHGLMLRVAVRLRQTVRAAVSKEAVAASGSSRDYRLGHFKTPSLGLRRSE